MNHLTFLRNLKFIQFIRFWVTIDDLTLKALPLYSNFLKFIFSNEPIHFKRKYQLWLKMRRSKLVNFNVTVYSTSFILLVNRVDYFVNTKQLAATSNSNVIIKGWDILTLFKLQSSGNPFLYMSNFYIKFIYFLDSWMVININYLYRLSSNLNLKVKPLMSGRSLFVINIKKI